MAFVCLYSDSHLTQGCRFVFMYKTLAFCLISMHPNFLCSTPVQHAAVSTSTAPVALSASAALPSQLAAELQIANQAPEQTAEPASSHIGSSHVR